MSTPHDEKNKHLTPLTLLAIRHDLSSALALIESGFESLEKGGNQPVLAKKVHGNGVTSLRELLSRLDEAASK